MSERDEFHLLEPCASCPGACCGFSKRVKPAMQLSDNEATFLRNAGTQLTEHQPPLSRGLSESQIAALSGVSLLMRGPDNTYAPTTIDLGVYVLESECGHGRVTQNGSVLCTAVNDPRRPHVCDKFVAGGDACNKMQKQAKQR